MNGFSFIVFPKENAPVMIVPEGEKEFAEKSWVRDIRTFGWGKITDKNPCESFKGFFKDLLNEKIIKRKSKIGIESNFEPVASAHVAGELMVPAKATFDMLHSVFNESELSDAHPIASTKKVSESLYVASSKKVSETNTEQ